MTEDEIREIVRDELRAVLRDIYDRSDDDDVLQWFSYDEYDGARLRASLRTLIGEPVAP